MEQYRAFMAYREGSSRPALPLPDGQAGDYFDDPADSSHEWDFSAPQVWLIMMRWARGLLTAVLVRGILTNDASSNYCLVSCRGYVWSTASCIYADAVKGHCRWLVCLLTRWLQPFVVMYFSFLGVCDSHARGTRRVW